MRSSPSPCSGPRSPPATATAGRAGSRPPGSRPARRWRSSTSPSSASVKKQVIEHLGQLDFLHGRQNVILLGPPGTGKTHLATALGDPRVPGRPARPVRDRDPMGRPARRSQTPGPARGRAQTPRADPAARRRRGRLHPVRPRSREPHVRARQLPLRARLDDRHLQQAVQRLGRDLRRRHGRHRDDRPAHPPLRDPLPQRRQLPAPRQRPRHPDRHQTRRNRLSRTPRRALRGPQNGSQHADLAQPPDDRRLKRPSPLTASPTARPSRRRALCLTPTPQPISNPQVA